MANSIVYNKAYYEANKENLRIKKRVYSQANKEKIAIRMKAYYETNKEKIIGQVKTYRNANKANRAVYGKAYYEANKEKIAIRQIEYYKQNPRKHRLSDPLYLEWALRNKKRAQWKSKLSGKGGKLNSHHMFPWISYPELRYEDGNGICLTKKEHQAYHKKWGHRFDPLSWMNAY